MNDLEGVLYVVTGAAAAGYGASFICDIARLVAYGLRWGF